MNYKLIVAVCNNGGIGKDGRLPWYIPSDLKRFSKITKGDGNNAIIMGRKTWESLPKKFLPKRDNLVISNTVKLDERLGDNILKSFQNIINVKQYCIERKYNTVWIIGGEQIYKLFLNDGCISEIEATCVDKFYDCDVYFPDVYNNFKLVSSEKELIDSETNILYNRYIYKS